MWTPEEIARKKQQYHQMSPEQKIRARAKAEVVQDELKRVIDVAENIDTVMDSIDKKYDGLTSFNKADWGFLAAAITLQIARQYYLPGFEKRLSDQEAARLVKGDTEEHSNRYHRWYSPSLEEIATNPVPYDAIQGSKDFSVGLSGITHRYKTPGHDPILGYIIGTMNILTSTITTWDYQSFHVKTSDLGRDSLRAPARNELILQYSINRILHGGKEGMLAFSTALVKQYLHLKSDTNTKESLPIPFISSYDPNLARKLSNYGIDMQNTITLGKQAGYSILMNTIITLLHRLCKPQSISDKIYEAKTRKILMYSNIAATSSNLIGICLSERFDKLDLGGSLVTLYRIISDTKFLTDLRSEFREKEFQTIIDSSMNEYGF